MANKIKYGLKNVHYAVITEETDGSITYGTPTSIPGAVSISLDAEGEIADFYADDRKYYSSATNDGYSGDLEMAIITDDFKKDVLSYKEDSNGVLFEDANAEPKNFALLFEFSGDKHATRHVLYNVSATRPSIASETKSNTKEPVTDTMSITASAAADTGMVKAKATPDQAVAYDVWYDSVYTYAESGE